MGQRNVLVAARVRRDEAARIHMAAVLCGESLSDFLRRNLLGEAREVLAQDLHGSRETMVPPTGDTVNAHEPFVLDLDSVATPWVGLLHQIVSAVLTSAPRPYVSVVRIDATHRSDRCPAQWSDDLTLPGCRCGRVGVKLTVQSDDPWAAEMARRAARYVEALPSTSGSGEDEAEGWHG